MSDLIFLSNVRISFPHLAEPQRTINDKTGAERIAYSADFLILPDSPDFQNFWKKYTELAFDKWKETAQATMDFIQKDRKSRCYGSGEEKVKQSTFQPYEGYPGMYYISTSNDTPPQIIKSDGTPIDPANTLAYQQLTRLIYGGCRVNAAIKPWLQDNAHGRGVRCQLAAVQFFKDDTPFGEGVIDASGLFSPTGSSPQSSQVVPPVSPGMPAPPFMSQPGFSTPGLPSFMQNK